jgi:hypothetical protein
MAVSPQKATATRVYYDMPDRQIRPPVAGNSPPIRYRAYGATSKAVGRDVDGRTNTGGLP